MNIHLSTPVHTLYKMTSLLLSTLMSLRLRQLSRTASGEEMIRSCHGIGDSHCYDIDRLTSLWCRQRANVSDFGGRQVKCRVSSGESMGWEKWWATRLSSVVSRRTRDRDWVGSALGPKLVSACPSWSCFPFSRHLLVFGLPRPRLRLWLSPGLN